MPHNAMDYLKEWDNEFETNSSLIRIYPSKQWIIQALINSPERVNFEMMFDVVRMPLWCIPASGGTSVPNNWSMAFEKTEAGCILDSMSLLTTYYPQFFTAIRSLRQISLPHEAGSKWQATILYFSLHSFLICWRVSGHLMFASRCLTA